MSETDRRIIREIEVCADCGSVIEDSDLQERPRSQFYSSLCRHCGIHTKLAELDGDAADLV